MNDTQETTSEQLTIEQIIERARAENLSNKKIRSLLFHAGFDYRVEFPAIREALGRQAGPSGPSEEEIAAKQAAEEAAAQARQEQLARETEARAEADKKAREEAAAQQVAAKAAIADGAVIWCDAAQNMVEKVVNRFGRKVKRDNGGCRTGLLVETPAGVYDQVDFNTKTYHDKTGAYDQFAAECYAVLKAVELAVDCGLTNCTVRNDRIGGFKASTKRGYIGAKYLFVASKIAVDNVLTVTFDRCEGSENRADKVSRRQD